MATRRKKKFGSSQAERHISVRAVRRDPPDLKKLSRALITMALAEVEAEAQNTKEEAEDKNDTKDQRSDRGVA